MESVSDNTSETEADENTAKTETEADEIVQFWDISHDTIENITNNKMI